ncbi:hypothetical protein VHEMI08941 [[Torrubiella] hemipterigena]|uniref:F-box domain-containing protein n=1 Tax=[Torrubiella] hemipterigena TaxID=1531966 RepID=A0A0A1TPF2_9HYPO|nr:hypothetical protein VHEMI08941 [[Torrubiella] hemipterigena]
MATQHPRPVVMDPPHITEFASQRYFEKLNQLNASQQQQTQHAHPSTQQAGPAPTIDHLDHHIPQSSDFILPLRESKVLETKPVPAPEPRQKSRFFNIRQKVSLLHKPVVAAPEPEVIPPAPRVSIESIPSSSVPLDQLILALPNELQLQIISSLPLTDLLNLRLTSKSWHTLITLNEAPIVRYHLDQHIPAYALRLYPVRDKSDLNFHHLCSLWHRLHVAAKLAFLMCEWITKDIFLWRTDAQRLAFSNQTERMRRRLIPLLFTVFHFFETYRRLHLDYLVENDGIGLQQRPYTMNPIERKIMDMYDDQTLLRVHEVFPLVISSFCRRLRPPTYVGRVERSLRGYLREKPADEVHVAILCLGGVRQVERLWEIKGYNSRRAAVDTWYSNLTKDKDVVMETVSPITSHTAQPPQRQNSTKSRFMPFSRKRSMSSDHRPHRGSFSESFRVRSPFGSMDATNYFEHDLIFNTSLAADAPMAPLDSDAAASLLKDLPVLQQIWLTTAEALVLLSLIQEDGIREEDEWWYGRGIPDSVRPVVGEDCDEM